MAGSAFYSVDDNHRSRYLEMSSVSIKYDRITDY